MNFKRPFYKIDVCNGYCVEIEGEHHHDFRDEYVVPCLYMFVEVTKLPSMGSLYPHNRYILDSLSHQSSIPALKPQISFMEAAKQLLSGNKILVISMGV